MENMFEEQYIIERSCIYKYLKGKNIVVNEMGSFLILPETTKVYEKITGYMTEMIKKELTKEAIIEKMKKKGYTDIADISLDVIWMGEENVNHYIDFLVIDGYSSVITTSSGGKITVDNYELDLYPNNTTFDAKTGELFDYTVLLKEGWDSNMPEGYKENMTFSSISLCEYSNESYGAHLYYIKNDFKDDTYDPEALFEYFVPKEYVIWD
jgi:hypothetical protein